MFVCLQSCWWTDIQTEMKLYSQWSYMICSLCLLCCLSCSSLLIRPAAHTASSSSCRTRSAMWRPPSARTRTWGQNMNSDASGVLVYVTSVFSDRAWWERPETEPAHTRRETAANMLSWFAFFSSLALSFIFYAYAHHKHPPVFIEVLLRLRAVPTLSKGATVCFAASATGICGVWCI